MLIEILYVPGCPNHAPTVHAIRQILHEQAIEVPMTEVEVADASMANDLQFAGSPTVRINGKDTEPATHSHYGLVCRLYSGGTGVPPQAVLRRAICEAWRTERAK